MDVNDQRRADAIERIGHKREFTQHLFVYGLVNALLVVIWAATGAGYFWPIWVIAGWGIGVVVHAWTFYGRRPITEEEIREETQRSLR